MITNASKCRTNYLYLYFSFWDSFRGVLFGVGAILGIATFSADPSSGESETMQKHSGNRTWLAGEKQRYLPTKSFTTLSPAIITRLQAICQTPTLTEPRTHQGIRRVQTNGDELSTYQPAKMAELTTRLQVLTNPLEDRKRVAFYTTLWRQIVGRSLESIEGYWIS